MTSSGWRLTGTAAGLRAVGAGAPIPATGLGPDREAWPAFAAWALRRAVLLATALRPGRDFLTAVGSWPRFRSLGAGDDPGADEPTGGEPGDEGAGSAAGGAAAGGVGKMTAMVGPAAPCAGEEVALAPASVDGPLVSATAAFPGRDVHAPTTCATAAAVAAAMTMPMVRPTRSRERTAIGGGASPTGALAGAWTAE